ncbi:UPF0426 protein [Acorus calamus]|uniref:UPF0426 protein n=1 Tax=Acorus calamus TaxID=4465 RepID=A0AAV9FQW1_ACOCL|nr:UPF0426 protein [Acorus calamus]
MEELLKNHMFAAHAITAAGSVAVGNALTHPLDTFKTLIQVSPGSYRELGTVQMLDEFRSVSGISDGREQHYVYVNEALLAGIAGAIEALVSTPFELFKVRAQASLALGLPTSRSARVVQSTTPVSKLLRGYTPEKKVLEHSAELLSALPAKHYNMVEGLRNYPWMMTGSRRPPLVTDLKGPLDIISLEGWWSLWRSLRSAMARDSIFCGVFFSSWQYFHLSILNQNSAHMDPPPRDIEDGGPVPPLMVSLAAGFSGSVAAAASHCFDIAKSRHDCSVLPKEPVAFMGEMFAGLLRLDLNEEPLKEWLTRTVET